MPQLTRDEMEAVIKGGGSVLYNGQTLTRLEHLPSAAALAEGDPEAEVAAAQALDTQIAQLQQQRDRLLARGQSPTIGAVIAPVATTATEESTAPDETKAPDSQDEKTAKKKAADTGKG